MEGITGTIVADLRHRTDRVRLQFDRSRQIVITQQGIENILGNAQRVDVGRGGRIETGLAAREHDAQGLAHVGGNGGMCQPDTRQYRQQNGFANQVH